jgi:hypothetical protein
MGNEIDFVRYRNDGDEFHVLWTARRALRLLDSTSGLVALAVEGVSEQEMAGGPEVPEGVLKVDTAEYYGSQVVSEAKQILYDQVKYSTTSPETPWPASDLADTIQAFAHRYEALCKKFGDAEVARKVRFRFITNRPISRNVLDACSALGSGTAVSALSPAVAKAARALLDATGMSAARFASFAHQLDLLGGLDSRPRQATSFASETRRLSLDRDATLRMKDLVRRKALSDSANDKTIDRDELLGAFNATLDDLQPAPSAIPPLEGAVSRDQEAEIAAAVLEAEDPVIIEAPGGVGKTVLAQRLGSYLPTGAETVVFDGFADGAYRTSRMYRHTAAVGLVQIVNEMAARGLCDPIVPVNTASDREYLQAFRNRLEQAAAVVTARAPEAVVLVVVDAADNLGMAAGEAQERCFAPALLEEPPPPGCRIVMLARPYRVEQYLRPQHHVKRIPLEPFTLFESSRMLRARFPGATDDQVEHFHRFTAGNPRVQANALAIAGDVDALCRDLGPVVETPESMIARQLDHAFSSTVRRQARPGELESLGAAIALMPPPIPLTVAALASGLHPDAVRSFVTDFAGGRPILLREDAIQFRDEPTETWFRDRFLLTAEDCGVVADRVKPSLTSDMYVAEVFPILLHRAERYEALMSLALDGAPPTTEDPVQRRSIVRQRVRYGLKAAIRRGMIADTAKLLLRAAEEEAADDREGAFLEDHADVLGHLAKPDVVATHIFRRRPWRESGASYVSCAAMLAADHHNVEEARHFLRLAMRWLREWAHKARDADRGNHDVERMGFDDIALYAETVGVLQGSPATAGFLANWTGSAPFIAGKIVARRLLDRGKVEPLEAILSDGGTDLRVALAILFEMTDLCRVPPRNMLELLAARVSAEWPEDDAGDLRDIPISAAVAALAECCAHSGLDVTVIRGLLEQHMPPHQRAFHSYDPERNKDTFLRMAALAAAIDGRDLTRDDVLPDQLQNADRDRLADDREMREFKEFYGPLVPWYAVRARAIMTKSIDEESELFRQAANIRSHSIYGSHHGLHQSAAAQDLVRLRLQALLWGNALTDNAVERLLAWIDDNELPIAPATWATSARIAVNGGAEAGDAPLRLAERGRRGVLNERQGADATANQLVDLARALVSYDPAEAAAYVEVALDHLSRFGDEIGGRLQSLLSIAEAAGGGPSSPADAYRVARAAELFWSYDDHKFPWHDVLLAVAKLDAPSALAVSMRLEDRDAAAMTETLPWVASALWEDGAISSGIFVALRAFGGYWPTRVEPMVVLKGLPDPAMRQRAFDLIVRDYELDPDQGRPALSDLVKAMRCLGLNNDRVATLDASRSRTEPPPGEKQPYVSQEPEAAVDWDTIFAGADLTTAEGVALAFERGRQAKGFLRMTEVAAQMKARVSPRERAKHLAAVASCDGEPVSWILNSLEQAAAEWSASLAVKGAVADAVRDLLDRRGVEISLFSEPEIDDVAKCSWLLGLSRSRILADLLPVHADQLGAVSAGRLFRLSGRLAEDHLSSAQALEVLRYALDRVEPAFKDDDGDGPWRANLAPPNALPAAIAGFIYASLASPNADVRWRAAHAVRRLCDFNESEVLRELVRLLPAETLPAFTGSGFPFLKWNARLWLMIALARAALDHPHVVGIHASDLRHWAMEGKEPHVLIRHFAAAAALAVEAAMPGTFSRDCETALRKVTARPYEPVEYEEKHRGMWHEPFTEGRFRLPFDFKEYWLHPLARVFGLYVNQTLDKLEAWICDHWGVPATDPSADRRRPQKDLLEFGRGQPPSFDSYDFYLCYHAHCCVAGELLPEVAPALDDGVNAWDEWLRRQLLSRSDGRWLADRRDPEPLDLMPALDTPLERSEARAEWPFSVTSNHLDQALGIDGGQVHALVVAGSWTSVTSYSFKQRVRVRSALVPRPTAPALLRALQTADTPYAYNVPYAGGWDDEEAPDPDFAMHPWIIDEHAERRLDQWNPLAGDAPYPGLRPTREIVLAFKLEAGADGRHWLREDGTPALRSEVWGDRARNRHEPAARHGERLTAELGFLLRMLETMDQDLIIEVTIERENERERLPFRHDVPGHSGYTRLYLLSRDGAIRTLYRHLRIRNETD